jgi:hypothetical protein
MATCPPMLRPTTAALAIPNAASSSSMSAAYSRIGTRPGVTGLRAKPLRSGAITRKVPRSAGSCGSHSVRSNGWPWIRTTHSPLPASSYVSRTGKA